MCMVLYIQKYNEFEEGDHFISLDLIYAIILKIIPTFSGIELILWAYVSVREGYLTSSLNGTELYYEIPNNLAVHACFWKYNFYILISHII